MKEYPSDFTVKGTQGALSAFIRRMGRISAFVSIFINHDHRAVHIATDEGRICRPLIIVENSKSRVLKRHLEALRGGNMVFDDFLKQGIVEYVDVNIRRRYHSKF